MRFIKSKSAARVIHKTVRMYWECRVSRSAAELAYFLTLSVFPTLICLHAMLGNLFPDASGLEGVANGIVPSESLGVIIDYLKYVTSHNSKAMLMAGLILMATTSAAAFRSVHNIMADIQGTPRFRGILKLVMSFLFSVIFLATIYFSVTVVITGNWFLKFIDDNVFFISISETWNWLRFVLMFLILFSMIYSVYMITAPKNKEHMLVPGAACASAALVGVSILFSWFIGISVRYPLVYGSLASIIILMSWLYICGNIVIMGNVLNIALRDEVGRSAQRRTEYEISSR